jgi:hypothetical protein
MSGGYSVCRNTAVADCKFHLEFSEQVYMGPARNQSTWHNIVYAYGEHSRLLGRERIVEQAFEFAHDSDSLVNRSGSDALETCVNPECDIRTQSFNNWRRNDLRGRFKCPGCNQDTLRYVTTRLVNKWVYILKKKNEEELEPFWEIEYDKQEQIPISKVYLSEKGEFSKQRKRYPREIQLPKLEKSEWHFFLSPVRLKKKSLKLLCQSLKEDNKAFQKGQKAKPNKAGVEYDRNRQPWASTCMRKFPAAKWHPNMPRRQTKECIPLVDAFSWAAEIADFDFAPILSAQTIMSSNKVEGTKAYIASMLNNTLGKDDPQNITSSLKSASLPKNWLKKYEKTMTYLAEETNKACSRLVFLLRYSIAHRIIELACQEAEDKDDSLAFALTHWVHVLNFMPASSVGMRFMVWLTNGEKDQGVLGAGERVPYKNVIQGMGIRGDTHISQKYQGLPLVLLTQISAGIFATKSRPAVRMQKCLSNINLKFDVQTVSGGKEVLTLSTVQDTKNLVLDVSGKLLTNYLDKMPDADLFKSSNKMFGLSNIQTRLKQFESIKEVESLFSVFAALKTINKDRSKFGGVYDYHKDSIDTVKAARTAAEFVANSTKKLWAMGMTKTERELIEELEKKGSKAIAKMATKEYDALIGSRTGKMAKYAGKFTKVLSGPGAIVIGGLELISTSDKMISKWDHDEPGEAVGLGLQAAGSILFIAVGAASTVTWITGAAVVAWAGPVGWVVAALMLAGAIIESLFADDKTKTKLQGVVEDTFLGKDFDQRPRYLRQQLSLMRYFSEFTVTINKVDGNNGGVVRLGYVLPSMVFHIEIDIIANSKVSDLIRLEYIPFSDSVKPLKGSASIEPYSSNRPGSRFIVLGNRDNCAGFQDLKFEMRVRLDLIGDKQHFLPFLPKKWVKVETLSWGNPSDTQSSGTT